MNEVFLTTFGNPKPCRTLEFKDANYNSMGLPFLCALARKQVLQEFFSFVPETSWKKIGKTLEERVVSGLLVT